MRRTWIPGLILTASLGLLLAAVPPQGQGQGKGKGGGSDRGKGAGRGDDARSVSRGGQNQGKGAGQARAAQERAKQPAANQGKSRVERGAGVDRVPPGQARARSDQRIERRVEREFAGDVERRVDLDGARPGARKRFARQVAVNDLRPALRRFYVADRLPQRVAVGAVARANLRGVDDDALVITPVNDRVRIVNKAGIVLVDIDERRARTLGRWDVRALDDRVDADAGAPSFCRSGAGHPVFGRQWCLDKGFGLGMDRDVRWARTTRLDDVVFLRPAGTTTLAREALITLLGEVAVDRLALHAITLGLVDPLVGRWLGEPSGSRVLLLTSGGRPVAEIVDVDRDDRADVMLVAVRGW